MFFLEFQIAVEDFVPGKSLLVEFVHEGVWIELFHVPHTGTLPKAEHEHTGTDAGRNAGGVANALHAGFFVSSTVRAVVVNVVCTLLAVLKPRMRQPMLVSPS